MSKSERNLLSGIWLMLFVEKRESGWPVRELMTTLRALNDDTQLTRYLATGAEEKFRRFVRERAIPLCYNAQKDTVTLPKNSPSTATDQWLVRYLSQQIQASQGSLETGTRTSTKCQSAVLKCMAEHLRVIYDGNLKLFFKMHPADFTVDESGSLARLTASFHEESTATFDKEENLVLFFVDLLQKIGATKDQPCRVYTLTKYLPFMKSAERKLLRESYRDNLNVFFLLNRRNFATTRAEKGSVFLKNYDPDYSTALFLKQQAHILSAYTSEHSPKIPLAELTSRVKHSASPIARPFFAVKSIEKKLRDLIRQHPAMFHMDELGEKLWFREERPPYPQGQWDSDAELLSVAFFIDVLKHIDATSPSRAICFNYIVHVANAAPPSCKDYLENVYPALEVIGLFHLHPRIFGLSSVNRVYLKTTEEAPSTQLASRDITMKSSHDSAEKEAVLFAKKLLKYARDLKPELLIACMESASLGARRYFKRTVKGRYQSVIKRARATLLSTEWVQPLNSIQRSINVKMTSEASTQTMAEPTPLPVTSDPECASKKEKTIQNQGQKSDAPRLLVSKTAEKKAANMPVANENEVSKDSLKSALPMSRHATAMSGTQKPAKAEKQIVLLEQAQGVGGQSTGGGLLARVLVSKSAKKEAAMLLANDDVTHKDSVTLASPRSINSTSGTNKLLKAEQQNVPSKQAQALAGRTTGDKLLASALVSESAKKIAATSFANGNVAHKDMIIRVSPNSSNSMDVSGTKKPLKAEQQIVPSEQAQAVAGQTTEYELLARVLVTESAKKTAATSLANGNVAHKDTIISSSPNSSNSMDVSGTKKHPKAEQQIVPSEQAQAVAGQTTGDELLANVLVSESTKKKAATSLANGNVAHKDMIKSASPNSSDSMDVSGTKKPPKAEQQIVPSEQAQAGQSTEGELLTSVLVSEKAKKEAATPLANEDVTHKDLIAGTPSKNSNSMDVPGRNL